MQSPGPLRGLESLCVGAGLLLLAVIAGIVGMFWMAKNVDEVGERDVATPHMPSPGDQAAASTGAFRRLHVRASLQPVTPHMEAPVSETTGTERIGESDARDAERDDPSIAGKPEIPAGEGPPVPDEQEPGRLAEREQRQHAVQQHGDSFAVDSEQPTDTSGVPHEDEGGGEDS